MGGTLVLIRIFYFGRNDLRRSTITYFLLPMPQFDGEIVSTVRINCLATMHSSLSGSRVLSSSHLLAIMKACSFSFKAKFPLKKLGAQRNSASCQDDLLLPQNSLDMIHRCLHDLYKTPRSPRPGWVGLGNQGLLGDTHLSSNMKIRRHYSTPRRTYGVLVPASNDVLQIRHNIVLLPKRVQHHRWPNGRELMRNLS